MKRTILSLLALVALLPAAIGIPVWAQSETFTSFILTAPGGGPTNADVLPCIEGSGGTFATKQCTPPQLLALLTKAQVNTALGGTALLAANNLLDVNSTSTSFTNLLGNFVVPILNGGTNASTTTTAVSNLGVLAKTSNLSDVSNTTTASNNLGVTVVGRALVGQIPGTATNDNAAAGDVGEFISSSVANNSVNILNGVATNITSISLTPGDWDVRGVIDFVPAASTVSTNYQASISSVSGTLPSTVSGARTVYQFQQVSGAEVVLPAGTARFNFSTTTPVYLVAFAQVTVSTMTAGGFIGARRMR